MLKALRAITFLGLLSDGNSRPCLWKDHSSPALFPSVQQADKTAAAPVGGQDTAGPHPPLLDAQHRPITAGGFVKTGPIVFEDVSEKKNAAP